METKLTKENFYELISAFHIQDQQKSKNKLLGNKVLLQDIMTYKCATGTNEGVFSVIMDKDRVAFAIIEKRENEAIVSAFKLRNYGDEYVITEVTASTTIVETAYRLAESLVQAFNKWDLSPMPVNKTPVQTKTVKQPVIPTNTRRPANINVAGHDRRK